MPLSLASDFPAGLSDVSDILACADDAYGTAETRRAVNAYLSPEVRAARERHEALWEWECAEITRLFRAVIDGDHEEFLSALAELHPAEEQRITALILLKNLAQKICEGEGNNDFNQDCYPDCHKKTHSMPFLEAKRRCAAIRG